RSPAIRADRLVAETSADRDSVGALCARRRAVCANGAGVGILAIRGARLGGLRCRLHFMNEVPTARPASGAVARGRRSRSTYVVRAALPSSPALFSARSAKGYSG